MSEAKSDFQTLFGDKAIPMNLRQAASAYLSAAIDSYLKIEGRVSVSHDAVLGDSANVVCSMNRAIEHLLKLYLFTVDPLLLYPMPKKVEDYCHIKHVKTKDAEDTERAMKEKEILSHTVSFKEAVKRVALTCTEYQYDFRCFSSIYSLRNSLEHHWDRNEEFLQKTVSQMSSFIIPKVEDFIANVLKEKPERYFSAVQIENVRTLDRALKKGHSLRQQKRFEAHLALYKQDPDRAKEALHYPDKYRFLSEEEDTRAECPVCKSEMFALWDLEPDYDVADGEAYVAGAYPDIKILHCPTCHYFVEGQDIDTYLPDGFEIDLSDQDWEEWY